MAHVSHEAARAGRAAQVKNPPQKSRYGPFHLIGLDFLLLSPECELRRGDLDGGPVFAGVGGLQQFEALGEGGGLADVDRVPGGDRDVGQVAHAGAAVEVLRLRERLVRSVAFSSRPSSESRGSGIRHRCAGLSSQPADRTGSHRGRATQTTRVPCTRRTSCYLACAVSQTIIS